MSTCAAVSITRQGTRCASRANHASERARKCHTRVHASPQVTWPNYGAHVGGSRFLEVDPVPGGSANDYDYCSGDPINCEDLAGTFRVIKRLWRKSSGGETMTHQVIGRRPTDSRGMVRVQANLNVKGLANQLGFLEGTVTICGDHGNCATRHVNPAEAALGKHQIHPSILLDPGEHFTVTANVSYLGGVHSYWRSWGDTPDVSVYDGTGR